MIGGWGEGGTFKEFSKDFQKVFQKDFQRTFKGLSKGISKGLTIVVSSQTCVKRNRLDENHEKCSPTKKNQVCKISSFKSSFFAPRPRTPSSRSSSSNTRTCLDTPDLSPARPHHTQCKRKHKHETRFPGWGSQAN